MFRAKVHNNLGNALWSLGHLGGREDGPSMWEKAVAAYGAALDDYTRSEKPEDWAVTQNNRGLALQSLGRLDEALDCYRAALTKVTPETNPPDWAMVQNNLGNVLVAHGERDRSHAGVVHLVEAIKVFRSALDIRLRAGMPLSWAMTQNNLGNALSVLGEREADSAGIPHLEAAIAAYHEALQEYTSDRVSLSRDRAMTQNNLGVALTLLGEREKNAGRLAEAVTVLRTSLEPRRKSPRACASTQKNLGHALFHLGRYRSAIEQYARVDEPLERALAFNALGVALRELDEREMKQERVRETVAAFEMALAIPELRANREHRDIVQGNLWGMQDRASRLPPQNE
jgi:tetratricopeptide (TPR) repeat protein